MKALKSIFFFFTGLLSAIVLFELILSLGGVLVPIVHIDKKEGERYFPNKLCCSLFVGEGFGLAKTNSEGWFGKEFKDKGPSDISIAVIGSSYIAARQVFYRDNFLTVAEQLTNEKLLHTTASYYNFGKEAMPLSELLYIKEEIDSMHHPDYFLVFLNHNSFVNATRLVPYYELKGDSLRLNLSFKESSVVKFFNKFPLLSKSSVFFLAYRVKNKLPQLWEILFDKFYSPEKKIKTSAKSNNPNNKEGFSIDPVNKAILEKLAADKKVIFLTDLDSAATKSVKSLITKSPVIDLQIPLLKMKKEQGIDPYFWKITDIRGHWNLPAHKVIGEEIAKNMATLINSK